MFFTPTRIWFCTNRTRSQIRSVPLTCKWRGKINRFYAQFTTNKRQAFIGQFARTICRFSIFRIFDFFWINASFCGGNHELKFSGSCSPTEIVLVKWNWSNLCRPAKSVFKPANLSSLSYHHIYILTNFELLKDGFETLFYIFGVVSDFYTRFPSVWQACPTTCQNTCYKRGKTCYTFEW